MKKSTTVIVSLVTGLIGASVSAGVLLQRYGKKVNWFSKRIDKFRSYFDIMNQWMIWTHMGRNLSEYFTAKGYRRIAIYGMGELGNRLYEELKDTDVEIAFAIDKRINDVHSEIRVVEPDSIDTDIDVIVITPVFDYENIEEMLMEKVDIPIISLEEVVYDM